VSDQRATNGGVMAGVKTGEDRQANLYKKHPKNIFLLQTTMANNKMWQILKPYECANHKSSTD
jgi:hypothetical protein